MASKNVAELKALAQKHSLHGKRALAAETYQLLSKEEPANPRWPQKAGEEYRTLGLKDKAAAAFQTAARLYARQGFTLKAITLCKLVLDLDSTSREAQQLLAGISTAVSDSPPPLHPAVPPGARPQTPALPDLVDLVELHECQEPAPPRRRTATAREPQPIEIPGAPEGGELPPADPLAGNKPGRAPSPAASPANLDRDAVEILIDEPEPDPENQRAAPPAVPPREEVLTRMPPIPIFSFLGRSALQALVERVAVRTFAPGARLITQGEQGNSLFVLVDGEVVVSLEGPPRVELTRLRAGAFFGEIALVTKAPRTATVEALRECLALEISRDLFNELVRSYPEMLNVILRHLRERLVKGLVSTHPLFAPFAGTERAGLVRRFSLLEAAAGCVVAERGARANGMYIMVCGEAESRLADGPPTILSSGAIFGVESLLTGRASAASVRTLTRCWILRMREDVFREVILSFPPVLAILSDTVADQCRRAEAASGGGGLEQPGIILF